MELVKYLDYDTCQIIEKFKTIKIYKLPYDIYNKASLIGPFGNIIQISKHCIVFDNYSDRPSHFRIHPDGECFITKKCIIFDSEFKPTRYDYKKVLDSTDAISILGWWYGSRTFNLYPVIAKKLTIVDSEYMSRFMDRFLYPTGVDRNRMKKLCIRFLTEPDFKFHVCERKT